MSGLEDKVDESNHSGKGKEKPRINKTFKNSETPLENQIYESDRGEGKEVQGEDIENIHNKIVTENFPAIEKKTITGYRRPLQNQTDYKGTPTHNIIAKI
jgi:hypothetical protein